MNSRSFFRILYGWDTENYLTEGLRYCAIFVKLTESLNDNLLVQYSNGTKRRVAGMFLFTDLDDALEWITNKKQSEIDEIDSKIYHLNNSKEKIEQKYSGIVVENQVTFTT